MKVNAKNLHAMVAAATTPDKRLAALATCFLTGQMPDGFRFHFEDWGTGHTLAGRREHATASLDKLKHTCKSTGCVAGLANFLFGTPESFGGYDAVALLGLALDERQQIFVPWSDHRHTEAIGPGHSEFVQHMNRNPVKVGRVLTKFIRTGVVDWSKTVRNTPVKVAGRIF